VLDLPVYLDPPVVEVVLAVGFRPLSALGVIHLAGLWAEEFRDGFPTVEEQGRIEMPVERLDSAGISPSVSLQMSRTIPLPRLWFVSQDRDELVQVQSDWFARNWRRTDSHAAYPMYKNIRAAFRDDYSRLERYVQAHDLGTISAVQCEMTYINHIFGADATEIIQSLGDMAMDELPRPEAVNLSVSFLLEVDNNPAGRLYVQVSPAVERSSGKPIIVLTVTARGRALGEGIDGITRFFDEAQKWTLLAFDRMTTSQMHQIWGRQP
jgi:uncharacterized protein (TIGR04255 family)